MKIRGKIARGQTTVDLFIVDGRINDFLASDAASYIHGEMIEINGGQLMM